MDEMRELLATRLEGEIVVLEPLARKHARALREAGAEASIWRWTSTGTVDEWLEHAYTDADRIVLATLRNGVPVGSSSYLALAPEHRRLEIGHTWLSPREWQTGANVEAKLLMLRHAFETIGCVRVEFKTDARNERSRRALEAIPAAFEGIHRKHMIVRTAVRDTAWYSVVDDEWPAVRANLERRLGRRA